MPIPQIKKQNPHETKQSRNPGTALQLRRTAERHPQEENAGEGSPHPMPGNIHHSVQHKENRCDQSGEPEALIRPLLQRKNSPNEDRDAGDSQQDHRPSHFDPEPKPIALGMDRVRSQSEMRPERSRKLRRNFPDQCRTRAKHE